MVEGRGKARAWKRPEVFWVVFVLASTGAFLGVVEPAWREHAAAGARLVEIRACAAEHDRCLEELRRARQGLEGGDALLWEAVARDRGMIRPSDVLLNAPRPHPSLGPR